MHIRLRDFSVRKRLFFTNFMMVAIPVCLLILRHTSGRIPFFRRNTTDAFDRLLAGKGFRHEYPICRQLTARQSGT